MNPQIDALIALVGSLTRENKALRKALIAQGSTQDAMHGIFGSQSTNNNREND